MKGTARGLFVATILTGSFLLFLVQPMVARMALPLLGGAPNVWNSAMLVYQALLLVGYGYAHFLSRYAPRKQAMVHVALLALAALTLPIALADLAPPAPGWEALWVPALLLATIGPLFFVVSAQAPLMQRWYAANGEAGDPYWLYAASNIGSFAGLICYPLLFEPNLSLAGQSSFWALGYALLVVLVVLAARSRWTSAAVHEDAATQRVPIPLKRIALWIALSAVPSGLMLSTTTHLTTDIVAMPLLWVIPLGLYLLSYVFAFNENSRVAAVISQFSPAIVLLAGGFAMASGGISGLWGALASVLMLFAVAVALHRRLYSLRPDPSQLTFFYLIMSAGGVLGGFFTALVAPLVFDWVWEHPLLVIAAAALLPATPFVGWLSKVPEKHRLSVRLVIIIAVLVVGTVLHKAAPSGHMAVVLVLTGAMAIGGLLVMGVRWAFLAVLAIMMLANGGLRTLETSLEGRRDRSYFGVYTVNDTTDKQSRGLMHGTTLHGRQFLSPEKKEAATTYYGPSAGIGLTLKGASTLYGPGARVGMVGLGVGTVACYRESDQAYSFFEIDPAVLAYSTRGQFTFLADCAPDAPVHLGDARLVLDAMAPQSFEVLAIDAFSSDSIPMHLLTREALDIYGNALVEDGILLIHISNRHIDLRPVLAAHAQERGWTVRVRDDLEPEGESLQISRWVAFARDKATLDRLVATQPEAAWKPLEPSDAQPWTDDHASILPLLHWNTMLDFGL